jgi:DNA polymerase II large subunit
MRGPVVSPGQKAYFDRLYAEAMTEYDVAKIARAKGFDPSLEVEIPPAEDLAARVEAQVGPVGVAERIREVTKELGNRELVSLRVASEVAGELHAAGESKEKCLDQAVRTGLSILTEGVLVAPLEGIAEVKIGINNDGTEYVDLFFAGPIRAAGGTGQAMSVLIADVVRRELKIRKYQPTDAEVERYKEEIPAYKQAANLQYTPTGDEIELIAKNCPICINGEGTEQEEVTGNRDLPRVEGNRLRGGACLVMAEGLVLKAPKLMKHIEKLGLEGWDFLNTFLKKGQKEDDGEEADPNALPVIAPNPKFVRDIIAGRPVFGHPSREGAFRLRYGRSRTAGLASNSFHPATMVLVDDFLAVGTQVKVERPGKGTLATPCDTIDGPAVLTMNGDLVKVNTIAEVKAIRPILKEILDLGEILIPYGEFAENNALMPHASYCWEWWVQEYHKITGRTDEPNPQTGAEMVALAQEGVPLHPNGNLLWHDLTPLEIRELSDAIKRAKWDNGITIPAAAKAHLEKLICPHTVTDTGLRIEEPLALPMLYCLGYELVNGTIKENARRTMLRDPCQPDFTTPYPSVELVSRLANFTVRPKAPCRIGGRMGRPEKADVRKMTPPTHGLFPIGQSTGNQRLIADALKSDHVEVDIGERICSCGQKTWKVNCPRCKGHTSPAPKNPNDDPFNRVLTSISLRTEYAAALANLGLDRMKAPAKFAVKVQNKHKIPEPMEKGLLRAKHQLWTFKDGTVRFDMTDIPITHFKPGEIHAPVERLHELGYTHDWNGEPLERDDQTVEIRVQDIIVSKGCMDYFLRVTHYIDELLERFYKQDSFYNCTEREDIIGQLAIGLAPHTSGGVLTRIIGWSDIQGHFGHPYFHAAKRRNCDGDEDAAMLLMDGLLNFSRGYVPDKRGGLMDLPLVLTTRLDPNEIDKESHNVDCHRRYPLEFFEATTRHANPKEVSAIMDLVEGRVGTEAQYEGFGFTHDTKDIAEGPHMSAYKVLDTMMDKMTAQMELARKTRAVDEADVGAKVIGTHFLPDLMGNLKAFSKQKVRCPACNAKYRRMPLKGVCLKCANPKLTLTVHEGSVRKYLNISKEIAVRYNIDPYTHQRILVLEQAVESLFNNDKVKKAKLDDFL